MHRTKGEAWTLGKRNQGQFLAQGCCSAITWPCRTG
uniref:Uncharacterized protein n=1 Tax=Arundo donax TaxID=35708 RepID=A0A0A8ZKX9_ARUDO